jgi:hypothetical protein
MVYALILVVHGLVFLFAQFNLELKCLIGYLQAAGIAEATHVLVYPAENSGSPLVSPLSHFLSIQGSFQLLGQVISVPTASFEFQKVCFHFSPEGSFSRLAYPCSGLSIKKLSTSVGYNSEKTLSMATQIWGRNEFNIPTPDFLEVYLVDATMTPPHLLLTDILLIGPLGRSFFSVSSLVSLPLEPRRLLDVQSPHSLLAPSLRGSLGAAATHESANAAIDEEGPLLLVCLSIGEVGSSTLR